MREVGFVAGFVAGFVTGLWLVCDWFVTGDASDKSDTIATRRAYVERAD